MSVWLCRAGKYGEHEARFLEENKIFYTFEEIDIPLSTFGSRRDLQEYFIKVAPTIKENAARVYAGQGYVFPACCVLQKYLASTYSMGAQKIITDTPVQ